VQKIGRRVICPETGNIFYINSDPEICRQKFSNESRVRPREVDFGLNICKTMVINNKSYAQEISHKLTKNAILREKKKNFYAILFTNPNSCC
jgi:hypothetical protein